MKYLTFSTPGADVALSIFGNGKGRIQAHAIVRSTIPGYTFAAQLCGISGASAEIIAKIEETTGHRVHPVFRRYFLSDPTNQANLIGQNADCAQSIVGQSPLDSTKVALWIWMQEDGECRDMGHGLWQNSHGQIWQGDPDDRQPGDSYSLTVKALKGMSDRLHAHGGNMPDHCMRTWFFVRDIDSNYAGVVSARNTVFAHLGLNADTHFIASTGIGAFCADTKQTVAFNAYADTTLSPEDVTFLKGRTHLNATAEYGVAFERATAVDYPDHREIFVSGTASIDNRGEIVAPGDISAQTMRMIENIGVLLSEGGCSLDDLAHIIIYLRDAADRNLVEDFFARQLPDVPRVIVLAPVCRPGWLIEAECIALKSR